MPCREVLQGDGLPVNLVNSRTRTDPILGMNALKPADSVTSHLLAPRTASGPAVAGDPDVQRGSGDRPAPRRGRQLRPHAVVRYRAGSGERWQLGSDARAFGGVGCIRRSRQSAAPFAEFRAPDRSHRGTGSCDRRCRSATGCRFTRSVARDPSDDRSLLRGLRRGVWTARIARRGIRLEALHRVGVLSNHACPGVPPVAAGRRRFPADLAPMPGCGEPDAGDTPVFARHGGLGRVSPGCCRATAGSSALPGSRSIRCERCWRFPGSPRRRSRPCRCGSA